MVAKGYIRGYEIKFDPDKRAWIFVDTGAKIKQDGKEYRPCKKCGQPPTKEEHDFCIKNLPGVINACCGHGVEDGYIQFENGIIIRGKFKIEKSLYIK